jgi:glucose-6-phosphate isomerase
MTDQASGNPPSSTLAALADHRVEFAGRSLASLFAGDPARFDALSFTFDGWCVDVSKERVTARTLSLLEAHADALGLPAWRDALFAGERVNMSEQRPALHTALRAVGGAPILVDGNDVMPGIRATRARIAALADTIRAGNRRGATGAPIRDVVNIGIGGSDLGPRLVCEALGAPAARGVGVHFVSNVDPVHLARTLAPLSPAATLFIVTSKTFTTQETLANATAAAEWLSAGLPGADIRPHFVAVTGNAAAARGRVAADEDVLPLPAWVGGRYSLWSAAGLPIAVAHGPAAFDALLGGAESMDTHFRQAPLAANLPFILGALGWWNARQLGHVERVIVPYAQALTLLPQFLQQLVLESNGKRVDRTGRPVAGRTAPAWWGAAGTDAQHAFFQWLHQGTREAPVEFIVPVASSVGAAHAQTLLVANALAQAQALLAGRSPTPTDGVATDESRACPGDRASTTLLLPRLDARALGQLLALYEHRTFVEATLYGINPFDQFGVELGKALAAPLVAALADGTPLPAGTDASTRGLVAAAQALRGSAG